MVQQHEDAAAARRSYAQTPWPRLPFIVAVASFYTHTFYAQCALRGFRPRAALLRRARGAAPGLRGHRRCPLLARRCASWPSRLCRALWPLPGLSPGAALRSALALCLALRGGLRRGAPLSLLPPVAPPPARGPRASRPRAAPLMLTFCFVVVVVVDLFLRRAQLLCGRNFCCFPLQVGTRCPRFAPVRRASSPRA